MLGVGGTALVHGGLGGKLVGWDTAIVLVPVQVCPCSCTELCAETSRIPCLRAP